MTPPSKRPTLREAAEAYRAHKAARHHDADGSCYRAVELADAYLAAEPSSEPEVERVVISFPVDNEAYTIRPVGGDWSEVIDPGWSLIKERPRRAAISCPDPAAHRPVPAKSKAEELADRLERRILYMEGKPGGDDERNWSRAVELYREAAALLRANP